MIKSDENIQIIECSDGNYVLTENTIDVDEEGKRMKSQNSTTFSKEDFKENVTALLTHIAYLLGVDYDKYGKENINITFDKKGHKVE
jgi:hypothetical protein